MKGWFERLREMDIVKLRIIVFSCLVLSFILALFLLRIGAKRLGLTGGEMPLLKLAQKEQTLVVQGKDIDSINKNLGREVIIEDRVKEVKAYPGEDLWVVKLTYVSITLDEPHEKALEKEGIKPSQLKGMEIRAKGVLKVHPIYGLQLFLAKDSNIEFVAGKVGH